MKKTLPCVGHLGRITHTILPLLCLVISRPYMHGISKTVSFLSVCYNWNLSITSIPWMWQILNALLVFTFSATFSYKGISPGLFHSVPVSPSLQKYFLPNRLPLHSAAIRSLSCFWNINPHFRLAQAISLCSLLKLSNTYGFPLVVFP